MPSKRLSLSVPEAEAGRLAPFIEPGTTQYAALQAWATAHGGVTVKSAASAMRVVLQAGIEALRADILENGYRELAESPAWTENAAERRALRDRHAQRAEGSG